MPYSIRDGKEEIVNWFKHQHDIKTIVDVGPGAGIYPRVLGDTYEWIGIEIWAPYVTLFNLHEIYKDIIIADVRHVILPKGDCVILGDVLEHMPKSDAKEVLRRCEEKYPHIIISTPINGMIQSGAENPFEAHVGLWTFDELSEFLVDFPIKARSDILGIFIK